MKKLLLLTITVISLSTNAQIAAPKFVDGSLSQGGTSGEILYNGVKTRVLCLREGYGNIPAVNVGTALIADPLLRPLVETNESGTAYKFWGDTKYNLDDVMAHSAVYVIILRINAQGTGYVPYVEKVQGKWNNLLTTVADPAQWVLPAFSASVENPIPTLQKGVIGGTVRILYDEALSVYFLG